MNPIISLSLLAFAQNVSFRKVSMVIERMLGAASDDHLKVKA